MPRYIRPVLLAIGFAACSGGAGPTEALSPFREGELITGRVLENSTACQVDAICSLKLVFADTTIIGIYGTGMRPAPTCQSPAEVTNIAFAIARDELVNVVLRTCDDGLSIQRLVRQAPDSTTT